MKPGIVILFPLILPCLIFSAAEANSSTSQEENEDLTILELEIKHRDFCLGKTSTLDERLQERVILDQTQVQFLQTRIKNLLAGELLTTSDTQMPLSSGTRLEILNYVITVQLGGKNMTVIVDTGSDLAWVQCQPCRSCYNQEEPLFDPSNSLSYQSISCNSSTCKSLQQETGTFQPCWHTSSACGYYVSYGDGSYNRGELATDSLDLGKSHIGKSRIDNFVFGCGRSNKGLFGEASGLMGLGKGNVSLISQTSTLFGGVFSYCLPSTDSGESGSLILGRNSSVYRNETPFSYTKMLQDSQLSSFYMLNLTGITVGNSSLKSSSFGENEILIDSGTVITRLPPSIYLGLKDEFTKQFSGYPSAPGFSILDTCFNLSGYKEVNLPTLRMQFEGNAELEVDMNGVFYFVKADGSQVCLAFASLMYEDETAIIGNYQQKNLRVVYDTKQSVVGFAKEQCDFA
ncbi:hypothetical protein Cgig2_007655 [Carnegiea gigantea]|uniref:Peptidase A1 domain-containing protein n=1 Tax=Carnegiea gigantea TaxID=171969 RepID=A0A9Q1JI77_9CARY|nr:hypothetical protein Cgig2_007655 [Carnegiea gigantea]